jgi:hypothetical protein
MTETAVSDLLRLAEHLDTVREPWAVSLSARLERLLDGEDPARALGLRSTRGRRRWRTVNAIQRRNAILRTIAAEFFPDMKPARQGQEIARELRRYAATGWRFDQDKAACPHPEDSLRAHFWLLMRESGTGLSARRIRKILATS